MAEIVLDIIKDATNLSPLLLNRATELKMMFLDLEADEFQSEQQSLLEDLEQKRIALILARSVPDEIYVGYGLVEFSLRTPDQAEFGTAFVLPAFRRRGILSSITRKVDQIVKDRGIKTIVAYPNTEGTSRRVLERHGYYVTDSNVVDVVDGQEIAEVDLKKDLT